MTSLLNFPFFSTSTGGLIEKPKTNSGEPPEKIQPKPCSGNYCFRATVKTLDQNDTVIHEFHGYSSDLHKIVEETENVCEIRRRDNQNCTQASVMFVRDIPNCNGLITMTDLNTNNTQIISYKHS